MLLMQCAAVKELYGSLRTEHEAQEDATRAAASALASLQEENKALKREVEHLQGVNARQVGERVLLACQSHSCSMPHVQARAKQTWANSRL